MNTLNRIELHSSSSTFSDIGQSPYTPIIQGFSTIIDESQSTNNFYTYLTINPIEFSPSDNRSYTALVEGQIKSLDLNKNFGLNFRHYIIRSENEDNISFDFEATIPNSINPAFWDIYNINPIIPTTEASNYQEVTINLDGEYVFQLYLSPDFVSASISGMYYMF